MSVKDSVTLGLPAHGFTKGMEVGGSSGHLVTPKFKLAEGEVAIDADTNEMGKMAFVPFNPEKGKMSMGRMVGSGWKSMGSSTPTGETILLVGKSTGMPDATSGGFAPQTTGVAK